MDDASGNVSKQWNQHWSCYLSNAALPREALQAEYNVRFVSTSPHASPAELMSGIRESIEHGFNHPTVAFDCETGEEILIRPFPLFWAGDNPMQSEHCSGHGLDSTRFCRTCDVGGTNEFKQSELGYPTLFKVREAIKRIRSNDTLKIVEKRLEMAVLPRMGQKIGEHARDTGIKDSLAQSVIDRLLELGKELREPLQDGNRRSPAEIQKILRKELESARDKGCVNPLLEMGGMGQSVFVLDKAKQLGLLESRLASINLSGLDLPPLMAYTGTRMSIKYMCQYRGALIGKHFKTIVQIMAFATYDILPAALFNAWLLLGRLASLLWYTRIDDIKS
ncbi:hypothetical protein BDV93DRAFT_534000 [Ceratobasidium sp. AG-I]|nr:hypothetical protein BDV93DRAFT_534000 [Ceratobasidium sp. AG-I]